MWPFKRKPTWQEIYAQRIYDGLVADNELGNITALNLRIPTALHQAYQNKIILQRELICPGSHILLLCFAPTHPWGYRGATCLPAHATPSRRDSR
jgi:hypothetical protein